MEESIASRIAGKRPWKRGQPASRKGRAGQPRNRNINPGVAEEK
jgi:hypothetical protein